MGHQDLTTPGRVPSYHIDLVVGVEVAQGNTVRRPIPILDEFFRLKSTIAIPVQIRGTGGRGNDHKVGYAVCVDIPSGNSLECIEPG
jgi:hypothetical protein